MRRTVRITGQQAMIAVATGRMVEFRICKGKWWPIMEHNTMVKVKDFLTNEHFSFREVVCQGAAQ